MLRRSLRDDFFPLPVFLASEDDVGLRIGGGLGVQLLALLRCPLGALLVHVRLHVIYLDALAALRARFLRSGFLLAAAVLGHEIRFSFIVLLPFLRAEARGLRSKASRTDDAVRYCQRSTFGIL